MRRTERIAVVHQSQLFRQCLAVVLGEDFEVREIDHDQPLSDLLTEIAGVEPAIAIIDLSLHSDVAIEVAGFLKSGTSNVKVVVIVTPETQQNLADYVVAGADAWVHQESSLDELKAAVRDVLNGQTFCAARLLPELVNQFAAVVRTTQWRERPRETELTQRELEILDLISARLSNKQIAKRLAISLYTVKNHVHSILEKLDVDSRHGAVDYARQRKWLARPSRVN